MGCRAPLIRRKVRGTAKQCARLCPYSTQDITDRIPLAERTDHSDTEGLMTLVSGPTGVGTTYRCDSNFCSFYLGTAVTELDQSVLDFTISGGHYIPVETNIPIPICSGTRFREY